MTAGGELNGLTAIVTGAAQGIGEGIALALSREGASVAVVDINLDDGRRVAAAMASGGGSAFAIQADVTHTAEVDEMVAAVLDRWGTIDILVNNAGGGTTSCPFNDITEEEWDRSIALNLKSVFLCCHSVVRFMTEKRKGRLINIASQAALGPHPFGAASYVPYGAAKAGVVGFTKHLAQELAPYGITVNAVSPGTTLTPRVQRSKDAESLKRIADMTPIRHLIEPLDIGEAVVFLASERARYITGVNLNVNGGILMT